MRLVNVVDLMRLETDSEHPHGLPDAEFDALAPVAICLAEAEGLAAHEGAIRARMRVRQQS